MSLEKALKNLKYDVRMTEYNLANGQITAEERKKHLDSLPDSQAQSEKLKIGENNDSSDQQH